MKDGFININKPAGLTSHDVVNKLRKTLGTKKIGHAGTLDPFATGVLPVAVGRATKFLEYLSNSDKSYRAEILFGIETDTGDLTGKIIGDFSTQLEPSPENFFAARVGGRAFKTAVRSRKNFPDTTTTQAAPPQHPEPFVPPTLNDIKDTLKRFSGTIAQTPPKYSAIKINGRKAYELARKNIDFELPTREVTIYNIALLDYQVSDSEVTLTIDVDCSKGTYIRSLAVDIGHQLGVAATLRSLQRTKFGNFGINESAILEEAKEVSIVPVDECLAHLPSYNLPAHRYKAFCNGLTTRLSSEFKEGTIFRVYVEGEFVGTGKVIEGELKATKIFRTTDC